MPVAAASAARPPSSAAIRSSSAATVGFEIRGIEDERRRLIDRLRSRAGGRIRNLPGVQAQRIEAERVVGHGRREFTAFRSAEGYFHLSTRRSRRTRREAKRVVGFEPPQRKLLRPSLHRYSFGFSQLFFVSFVIFVLRGFPSTAIARPAVAPRSRRCSRRPS